jgi:protein TonB
MSASSIDAAHGLSWGRRSSPRLTQPLAYALGIEALLLIVLVAVLSSPPAKIPPMPVVLSLALDPPPAPELKPKVEPAKPLPAPAAIKPQPTPEPPRAMPALPRWTDHAPTEVNRPVETTRPEAAASPIASHAPAPPAPPPVASPPTVDPALAYNAKLAAAVQAAFVVPSMATTLGFKGRARVEFKLRDGTATDVRILQPSGLGAVDRAALKAVAVAQFPSPPTSLMGKEGIYQIWVECF